MGVSAEAVSGVPDTLKWLVAAVVLGAALGAFYYFGDHSLLLRVVVLLAAIGVAGAVGATTARGRMTWEFIRESRTEVRKVVWPSRKETTQTTLVVMAMVALVAMIMWLLDGVLSWFVRAMLGQGG